MLVKLDGGGLLELIAKVSLTSLLKLVPEDDDFPNIFAPVETDNEETAMGVNIFCEL